MSGPVGVVGVVAVGVSAGAVGVGAVVVEPVVVAGGGFFGFGFGFGFVPTRMTAGSARYDDDHLSS